MVGKNIFQDIQKHAIDTGKVIDNIGQKKTTLETNLRDLEGTERMLAHLNNMRIREVKGQNFWRDNVVNGGGDAIQQSENYYDSYVKNKGQNQLGMGNWSSVDSGKPGFSPIKWVQNQGSNLEYRRQKRHESVYLHARLELLKTWDGHIAGVMDVKTLYITFVVNNQERLGLSMKRSAEHRFSVLM